MRKDGKRNLLTARNHRRRRPGTMKAGKPSLKARNEISSARYGPRCQGSDQSDSRACLAYGKPGVAKRDCYISGFGETVSIPLWRLHFTGYLLHYYCSGSFRHVQAAKAYGSRQTLASETFPNTSSRRIVELYSCENVLHSNSCDKKRHYSRYDCSPRPT